MTRTVHAQPQQHEAAPPVEVATATPSLDPDTFAAYLVAHEGLADNTVRTYRLLMQKWVDWSLGADRRPEDLDPLVVREWANALPGSGSLRGQARAAISHACAMLDVEDVSPAVPVPRKPRAQSRALPQDDAAALEAAAHHAGRKGTAVLVGLYTAGRRSEIASLAWPRVDFDGGMVKLWRQKTRDWHDVGLHPVLAEHLQARRLDGDDMWVFPGRNGGHISPATVAEWVQDVARLAGIGHITCHQLRHTALTEANDQTGDLRAVQQFAGHTNPAQTAIYTRASQEAMGRVMHALRWGNLADEDAARVAADAARDLPAAIAEKVAEVITAAMDGESLAPEDLARLLHLPSDRHESSHEGRPVARIRRGRGRQHRRRR